MLHLLNKGENLSNEQLMSEYSEGNEMSFLLGPQIALLSSFLSSYKYFDTFRKRSSVRKLPVTLQALSH